MTRLAGPVGLALVALLVGCGDGDGPAPEVTFEFKLHGEPDSEAFRVRTQDAQVIEQTRAQLALPVAQRKLFPHGALELGHGGYNLGWGWHFSDYRLSQMSIELCDATPSYLQAHLDEWMAQVKTFCPWAAYVVAEVH